MLLDLILLSPNEAGLPHPSHRISLLVYGDPGRIAFARWSIKLSLPCLSCSIPVTRRSASGADRSRRAPGERAARKGIRWANRTAARSTRRGWV